MRLAERPTQAAIDALVGVYRFVNPGEVRYFLDVHPDIFDVVNQGASKIPEFVPSDSPIDLEVVWEVDGADDPGELIAVVRTKMEPEDVLPRLERLRRCWLIEAIQGTTEPLFTVGVEYH